MRGSFFRNLLTLLAGSSLAQILSVLFSPILSRIFSPQEFGSFALFSSITAIAVIIATGRYEVAILIPEADGDALDLAKTAIALCLASSLLALALIDLMRLPLLAHLKIQDGGRWLYAVPPTIFLMGTYQTLYNWTNRRKLYRRMAGSRIGQSLVTPLTNIPLGRSGWGVWGLVSGQIAGQTAACCFLIPEFLRDLKATRGRHPAMTWKNAKQYRKFPLHNIPGSLLNSLSYQLPIILLTSFFGGATAGLYFFSYRLVNLPMNLIGTSLSDVYYKHSMDMSGDPGRQKELIEKIVAYLIIIAIIPFVILLFFGGGIFAFVFGAQWRISGIYTQIMAPFILMRFLSSPLTTIFFQKGKTFLFLKWQTYFFISIAAALVSGHIAGSPPATVVFISLVSTACYTALLAISLRLAGASIQGLPRALGRVFADWRRK